MITRLTAILAAALVAGLALIYVMAPGPLELAAMKAREGHYRAARAEYEALLRDRGPVREVVTPLAALYEDVGDNDAALDLLARYLKANPADIAMARYYAGLLDDMQREDERIVVLEAIAGATGDPSVLHELALLYDFRGEHAKRAAVLFKLAQMGEASFDEFIDLAHLLAAQGQFDRALAVSLRAVRSRPQDVTQDIAELHVALAIAAERMDLADDALAAWRLKHDTPRELLAFSQMLEEMGVPDLGWRLLAGSRSYAAGDEAVHLEALRLDAVSGHPARSFAALVAMGRTRRLSPKGLALLADLGFNLGRYSETFAALAAAPLAALPQNTQVAAIDQAAEHGRGDLLAQWRAQAGTDWRGLAPVAAARLALGLGDRTAAARLAERALAEAATDETRANAARALADAGRNEEAFRVVSALGQKLAQGDLAPEALAPLAEDALALKLNTVALAAAEKLAAMSGAPSDQALYARALTATGQAKRALALLDRFDSRDPAIEAALVGALKASGQRDALQAFIFARLADPNMPRARRNDLLDALVDSAPPLARGAGAIVPGVVAELKQPDLSPVERRLRVRALALADPTAALPFARALMASSNSDDIILYADLLSRSGHTSEAVRVLAQAAARARTKQAKEDFVDALMKLGGIESALPVLADLAEHAGGDWHYAYEDALQRLGRRDALAAALVRHAEDPATTRSERRDIAYSLLAIQHKDDAERIFAQLAQGAGPTSSDAENLLFVWGPRPGAQKIVWMAQAARAAKPEDRAGWVKRILDAGAPREAAALAEEFLATASDAGLLDAAARAYLALNDRQSLERLLVPAVPRIDDADTAEHFARLAQEGGANYPASLLFDRAQHLDPKRLEDLAAAGVTAFYDGMASRARPLLQAYVEGGGHSPEARFALAEIDLRDEHFSRARIGFEAVIAASEADPRNRPLARLRAMSLLRLHRDEDAFEAYQDLIASSPEDDSLRASAAEALLDSEDATQAAHLLGNAPQAPRP